MELSKTLRDHSKTIKGKQQLIMTSYAKALEIIPRQLVRRNISSKHKMEWSKLVRIRPDGVHAEILVV